VNTACVDKVYLPYIVPETPHPRKKVFRKNNRRVWVDILKILKSLLRA
jgi:hypothetical protein